MPRNNILQDSKRFSNSKKRSIDYRNSLRSLRESDSNTTSGNSTHNEKPSFTRCINRVRHFQLCTITRSNKGEFSRELEERKRSVVRLREGKTRI